MEFKSAYYKSFSETMEKYDMPEGSAEFAGDLQAFEEMLFGFHIGLLI